jgi:predicted DNA repair protein MutK
MKTRQHRLSANKFVWLCAGLSVALLPLMMLGAVMLGVATLCMFGFEKLASAMRPGKVQVTRYMPVIETVERRRRMRMI